MDVYSSFTHNRWKVEVIRIIFMGERLHKLMIHPYNGILFNNFKRMNYKFTKLWINLNVLCSRSVSVSRSVVSNSLWSHGLQPTRLLCPWNFPGKNIGKKVKVKSLSRVWLFVTPWTVAYQAPPSMGFSRQEYWSGLPFPSPGDLPDSGIEPRSPPSQADTLTSEPPGKTSHMSTG